MPSMSGYDTAKLLRARLGADVLLVATTGWGQDEHRQRSHRSGFNHHLVKPVDAERLTQALLEVASSQMTTAVRRSAPPA